VQELVRLDELIEEAVVLAGPSKGIAIERDFEVLPELTLDRHRLLEILVNLVGNACEAIAANPGVDGVLGLVLRRDDVGRPRIEVRDNGIGIANENLAKVFAHGFTTKADGHGFGLHASGNAAAELGATIACTSDGRGRGACFVLALPSAVASASTRAAA
jgi:signal transduction histidine kinase